MAIVNFNSVSGVSTISATSSVTVGTGLTITTGGIVGITSINDGQIGGSRNMIINGSMVINQRGLTGASGATTNNSYTTDRFNLGHSHDGAVSAGQTSMNSTIGGNAYNDGFKNALILRVTTADASLSAGQFQLIRQRIEGYNVQGIRKGSAGAEPVTLSFWVRSSTTGTYIAELYDNDNTRSCSQAYTINTSNTWEKKSIVFPADTTGVLDNDENTSLVAGWWLAAGSTYSGGTLATTWAAATDANRAVGQVNALAAVGDFWLTGVQLEVGPTATEFERRSFGQELALCQRYYEKSYALNTAPGTNTDVGNVIGRFFGNGDPKVHIRFSVAKRAAPTMTFYTPAGTSGSWRSVGTVTADRTVTSESISEFSANAAITSTMDQLNGHWVASIEL